MLMNKLETGSYKGVRDFYPQDQFIQNYIFKIWRETVESFGYNEYEASILEPSDLYKAKSGDEIINEQTYTFIDRGGREVTLRPEMTPTVARMVAARKRDLGFPLRWYSIPNLFRYEAPQRGRLREHWQLNVDLFGVKTIEADVELITLAYQIIKNFGAKDEDFEIRMSTHGDKKELENVIGILNYLGIQNTRIDETLKRGQAYYTGIVFEFFDTDKANPRSILGGGRYDELLALFNTDLVPAVGFGAGDVTIKDFLETHNLLPEYRSSTDLLLVLQGELETDTVTSFYALAKSIREAGSNISTDTSMRVKGDLYKVAEKQSIPYIAFIDKDGLKASELIIRNMTTREEHTLNAKNVVDIIKILKS
jgi:histidyl-tRNA synthetase